MVTHDSPPDLDALRRQLGDAMLDARLAEAHRREELLKALEVAVAGGASFEAAARKVGGASCSTLRRWHQAWRSFGLVGLVERKMGPPQDSVRPEPDQGSAAAQLVLGMDEGPRSRAAPPPRRDGGAPPSPLVKWPGSKVPIVRRLTSLVPDHFERYHEPFVGGGALFFALCPARAVLGDDNAELVNLYRVVRDEPESLIAALTSHQNTREHYHRVRGVHPDSLPPVERAARMFFLNRTCFNGLYRVNRHGLFNVPYGSQDHTTFFQPTVIRKAHRALLGAEIVCEDFEACLGRARARDLVYLDPPYAASLNEGRAFKYRADGFGEADQRRVADLFRRLDGQGCLVMASNADCELTRRLYAGFEITELSVGRRIGGRPERRGRAAEIVIRNYSGERGLLPGL